MHKPHMVMYIDGVKLPRGDGGLDDWGVSMGAETYPANLTLGPVFLQHVQAAATSYGPVELLHGVDAMNGEDVDVVHLRPNRYENKR